MLRSDGPEGDGEVDRYQVDAHLLHDRADGALGDAVQLVDVRGACYLVNALVSEHLPELAREELARVVALDVADDLDSQTGPSVYLEACI